MIHRTKDKTTWLEKSYDLKHGFGWFCQIYTKDFKIGFGFSKNKFTAVRLAIKSVNTNN